MKHELLLGAHTSAAGGAPKALLQGQEIGATTIQLFTSNQKQWKGRHISSEEIEEWFRTLKETGLQKIMSHDSYLINLGSPEEEMLAKSRQAFQEEIDRCLALGITYLNFHPGAALKGEVQSCLDRIVDSLLRHEKHLGEKSLRLLFEATAGQGSCVGYTFEQLGYLVERTHNKIPVGVCLDTCHIFAAGYDIRTAAGWEKVLGEFDRLIGLKHLYAFHLNDSKNGLGTRRDRHEQLGKGEIGLECFRFLVNDPRTCKLAMYLETPEGPAMWKKEITLLRELHRHA